MDLGSLAVTCASFSLPSERASSLVSNHRPLLSINRVNHSTTLPPAGAAAPARPRGRERAQRSALDPRPTGRRLIAGTCKFTRFLSPSPSNCSHSRPSLATLLSVEQFSDGKVLQYTSSSMGCHMRCSAGFHESPSEKPVTCCKSVRLPRPIEFGARGFAELVSSLSRDDTNDLLPCCSYRATDPTPLVCAPSRLMGSSKGMWKEASTESSLPSAEVERGLRRVQRRYRKAECL